MKFRQFQIQSARCKIDLQFGSTIHLMGKRIRRGINSTCNLRTYRFPPLFLFFYRMKMEKKNMTICMPRPLERALHQFHTSDTAKKPCQMRMPILNTHYIFSIRFSLIIFSGPEVLIFALKICPLIELCPTCSILYRTSIHYRVLRTDDKPLYPEVCSGLNNCLRCGMRAS